MLYTEAKRFISRTPCKLLVLKLLTFIEENDMKLDNWGESRVYMFDYG